MKDKLLALPGGLLDSLADLMKSPKKLLLIGLSAYVVLELVTSGQSTVVDYGIAKATELIGLAGAQVKEHGLALAALVGVYYLLKK